MKYFEVRTTAVHVVPYEISDYLVASGLPTDNLLSRISRSSMYQNLIRPCSVRNHGAGFGLLIQIWTLRKHIICTPTASSWYYQLFITNPPPKYNPHLGAGSGTGTSIPAEYVDPYPSSYQCFRRYGCAPGGTLTFKTTWIPAECVDPYLCYQYSYFRWFTTQVPGTRTCYGRTGSQYLAS